MVDNQAGMGDTSAQDSQEDIASSYVTVSQSAAEIVVSPQTGQAVGTVSAGQLSMHENNESQILNPEAESFVILDQRRIHPGRHGVSIQDDVRHVQQVQAGGVGAQLMSDVTVWNSDSVAGQRSTRDSVGGELWTGMPFHGGRDHSRCPWMCS